MRALGWKWVNAGPAQPAHGRELTNSQLKASLESKMEFTRQEWEAFEIKDLRYNDYIKSGASFFQPDVTEHDHWICRGGSSLGAAIAHGNTAGYGNCAATLYHHLAVVQYPSYNPDDPPVAGLSPDKPIPAGQLMMLTVLKKDMYNQDMLSDSTSQLQVWEADDDSVSFPRGSRLAKFTNGQANFSFALKPTFAEGSTSLLVQPGWSQAELGPRLYFEGVDSARDSPRVSMQTVPALVVHITQTDKSVCPPGSVLRLDANIKRSGGIPGECVQCQAGTYSLSPLGGCADCPRGAQCLNVDVDNCSECIEGASFKAISLDRGGNSTWTKEIVNQGSNEEHRLRITSCPRGYALIRDPGNPQGDLCEACPANTYSVQDATFDPNKTSASEQRAVCLEAPSPKTSVKCDGDSIQDQCESVEGWFLIKEFGDAEVQNLTTSSTRRQAAGQAVYRTYRCEPGVCLGQNKCSGGRDPSRCPVCGCCPEGYVLELNQCQSCDTYTPEVLRASRVVFGLVVASIILVAWFLLCWTPLFGSTAAGLFERCCGAAGSAHFKVFTAVGNKSKQFTEYVKILIGYFVQSHHLSASILAFAM